MAIPQRRRRIFVVGYFGSWRRAAEVLFESHSVLGDTPPRRAKRKATAGSTGERVALPSGTSDGFGISQFGDVAGTLTARGDSSATPSGGQNIVAVSPTRGAGLSQDCIGALFDGCDSGCDRGNAVGFQINHGDARETEVACTLDAKCKDGPIRNQAGMVFVESGKGWYAEADSAQTLEAHEDQHRRNIICMSNGQSNAEITSEFAPTLTSAHDHPLICVHGSQDPINNSEVANAIGCNRGLENCICFENHAQDARIREVEVSQTISARMGTGGNNLPLVMSGDEEIFGFLPGQGSGAGSIGFEKDLSPTLRSSCGQYGVLGNGIVRRLTPVETERLMGFPDNHTLIEWSGKAAIECPDAPRYKACGNSMCVNAIRWLGERIQMVEDKFQDIKNGLFTRNDKNL